MKYYIVSFLIIIAVALPVYLLLRRPWRYGEKREWLLGAFVIYFIALWILVLSGHYASPDDMAKDAVFRLRNLTNINIIPFRTIRSFISWGSADEVCVNIISNIVMFVPFGFCLPALWKKLQKLWKCALLCLAFPICIETLQLFIWRNTDIDDIILNYIGGMLGTAVFFILNKHTEFIKKFAK